MDEEIENYGVGVPGITEAEFQQLSQFIYKQFGIHLPAAKKGLLVRRLQNLIKEQYTSFGHYYQHLIRNPSDGMFSELVNRITTNYTFFYREPAHFEFFLKHALPDVVAAHLQRQDFDLRIWCAAASSGEEPYTLGLLLMEYLGFDYANWDAGILATDISEKALLKARAGVYQEEEFQLMPKHYLTRYFRKQGNGNYEVIPSLKKELTFRRFNLIKPRFAFQKPFDIIFCRNVMIYFDEETKLKVIQNLHDTLRDGGYLFIGHSESLMRYGHLFKFIQPAVYRKVT